MDKDDYILKRLSKLIHKKWELFVITRIIHALDDSSIEFVCQQHVRLSDGKRALSDIFFPQFGVHLEIDESQHASDTHQKHDLLRELDIVDITGHQVERIATYFEEDGAVKKRKLSEITRETDRFIELINRKKEAKILAGEFEPWNFEHRFDSARYTARGHIDISDNVVFQRQDQALRCFGFTGKRYQRGAWPIDKEKSKYVWFPRLYPESDWCNELSDDGCTIYEKRIDGSVLNEKYQNDYPDPWSTDRITFARMKDDLGTTMYRFIGEFQLDRSASSERLGVFHRTSTWVQTIAPEGEYDPNKKFGGTYDAELGKFISKQMKEGKFKIEK
jgi:SET and RING associated domain/Restriction endonuclease PvuRts1 I-like, N-terminal